MKSWAKLVAKTWLGNPAQRSRFDQQIRRWLGDRRGVAPRERDSVVALTVERAHAEITQAPALWLSRTTMIALTGELVLGARHGKILSNAVADWDRNVDRAAWIDVTSMNLLRNCVCHPADQPIPALCAHIHSFERDYVELADSLKADWSRLGEPKLAEYAIRKLDAVGRHAMHRYKNA